jgi:hypothetical protein
MPPKRLSRLQRHILAWLVAEDQHLQGTMAAEPSLQTIASMLNAENVPTLSSKGHWQKGTIGNLLAQDEH